MITIIDDAHDAEGNCTMRAAGIPITEGSSGKELAENVPLLHEHARQMLPPDTRYEIRVVSGELPQIECRWEKAMEAQDWGAETVPIDGDGYRIISRHVTPPAGARL